MQNKNNLAIITVVYNNYEVLGDFINSLKIQKNNDYRLYIADASENKQVINTNNILADIIPISNLGYAHGVNVGIKQAQKDGCTRFCVINDDTLFKNDFTASIKNMFDNYPNTIFGGKIYYAKGYEYHNRYKNDQLGNIIWYAGGDVKWKDSLPFHIGVDEVDNDKYSDISETKFITGCMICFDNSVVNSIGFWDEKYFLYFEDADYCERAKRKNISLKYLPTIKLWHKNAQSTDGSGSVIQQKYQKKSLLRFAIKYAPLRTKLHVMINYIFK